MALPEPPPPRIRPIWLIGGSAVLVVLAGCALLSVAAAAVLIWFSSGISSHTATATPKAAVVESPTQTIIAIAPTPLPGINTAPPPTATPESSVRPAPDQAIRNYYQYVSQQRYDLSWPLLTDTFKQKFNCCAPNYDYTGYVNWWNSVNYVDFGTVSIVSQTPDHAVVYAQIYYVMNTGARSGVDSNPYFELVYDSASDTWRFNDKRAAP